MSYFTVRNEGQDQFEEKKSVFIGYAKRVNNEEEAKEFIDTIKNKHKDATHNVYAYIVGENMGIQRYSDDGEPQGTAGIPVLEVIKKNKVTDVSVVVTRYFGGTLLGAGGLVRAYSKGAAIAIESANVVEKVEGVSLNIITDYDLLGKIQYACGQNNWYIENIEYTDKVTIKIYCETNMLEKIRNKIVEITSGKGEFKLSKEKYYFKSDSRLYQE